MVMIKTHSCVYSHSCILTLYVLQEDLPYIKVCSEEVQEWSGGLDGIS